MIGVLFRLEAVDLRGNRDAIPECFAQHSFMGALQNATYEGLSYLGINWMNDGVDVVAHELLMGMMDISECIRCRFCIPLYGMYTTFHGVSVIAAGFSVIIIAFSDTFIGSFVTHNGPSVTLCRKLAFR